MVVWHDNETVRIPMMPKGVEHFQADRQQTGERNVRIPMMPKGVEHVIAMPVSGVGFVGENSHDAERR